MKKYFKVLTLIGLLLTISPFLQACSTNKTAKKKAETSLKASSSESVSPTKDSSDTASGEGEKKTESQKTQTSVYEKRENEMTMKLTYTYKGDHVQEQTSEITNTYAAMGMSREETEEYFNEFGQEYEGIAGVTHTVEYQENQIIERTVIDYTIASFEEVSKLVGGNFKGPKNAQFVSMKLSEKMLEEEGFVKTN